MARRYTVLIQGLLVGVSTLFALGVYFVFDELYLEAHFVDPNSAEFLPVPEYRSPYVFVLKPNSTLNFRGVPASVNNLSFRDRSDMDSSDKSPKILSYGDSVGLGVLLSDDQTYAKKLERSLIGINGRSARVINAARGHSPTIFSFHARIDLPRIRPVVTLVEIELTNDLGDEAVTYTSGADHFGLPTEITSARYGLSWGNHLITTIPVGFGPLQRTLAFSDLSHRVGYLLTSWHPSALFSATSSTWVYNLGYDQYYITPERLNVAFEQLFAALSGIRRVADENGSAFVVVIMPSQYVFQDSKFRAGAERMIEQAEAEAQKRNLQFVSLRNRFASEGGAALYFDFCHPNDRGTDLISDEIRKKLLSLHLVDPQSVVPLEGS